MRTTTHARWAVCAMALALATAGCGGGGDSGDSEAVLSASWGDPQNPLEPSNTNDPEAYARTLLTGFAEETGKRFAGVPAVAFELFPR